MEEFALCAACDPLGVQVYRDYLLDHGRESEAQAFVELIYDDRGFSDGNGYGYGYGNGYGYGDGYGNGYGYGYGDGYGYGYGDGNGDGNGNG